MLKQTLVVLAYAVTLWAFCGAIVGIGRQFLSMETTLVAHAVGAPIGAVVISALYFRNAGYTGPLATATIFVVVALTLDFAVVAPFFERSYDMFVGPLGVWLPMALIFAAIYLTGQLTGPSDEMKA